MKQTGSFFQKNTATFPAKTVLFVALLLWAMTTPARAQTTWTGATDTDWATPSNWSAGVPGAAIDAIIPDVANDPIIGAAASAQSITVQSGAVLTIAAAVTLTINGFVTQGILNQGTVENSGTLNIGQNTSTGLYGIRNESVFNNNTGGQINIDRSTNTGLYNVSGGTFTNAGTITMGTVAANVATYGIVNESVFNNNTGGQINIDRRVNTGLYNFTGGTFTNAATITVGAVSQVPYGIRNESTFNNNTGGQISIDRWTNIGLNNVTGGTFTNVATITIGVIVVANGGDYGIRNESVFNNNTGGQINIDRSRIWGLYNFTGGTFTNAATITMGAVASVGNYGIWNNAAFNNNTGGQIKIDRWTSNGLYNVTGGTFTNAATITIGALVASTGFYGIFNESVFNNNTGGQINIDRSTDTGLYNFTGGTFTNETTITIGAVASVGTYGLQNKAAFNNNTGGQINIDRSTSAGLYNLSGGTFTNAAAITIGAVASVGTYGIHNVAAFNNNTGGQINIDRSTTSGIFLLFGTSTFPNAATITIGALVPMTNLMTSSSASSSGFINNTGGVLKGTGTLPAFAFTLAGGQLAPGYSPGKMTFNTDEDFSNSILAMEVASGGGVGGADFDQVVVTSGAATVGTNTILNLVFSYAAADGATFDILTATSVSGTISPANIFVSNTGAGNVTAVTVSHSRRDCPGNGEHGKHLDGRYEYGLGHPIQLVGRRAGCYPDRDHPERDERPDHQRGSFRPHRHGTKRCGAHYRSGGDFDDRRLPRTRHPEPVEGGKQRYAQHRQTTGTGLYGIQNNGAFNNNTGGQINIDRSSIAGLYNFNGSSFTNVANITIGAVAGVGTYGIQNNSTFSNNTGGQINIDRATTSGILLNAGTFFNTATAIIGALVPITNLMTRISGTFNNNTGGF
ncbi:MAG: hypothetical protein IPL27_20880 [Lewinellaceae bacterium]|nr:hypothetical protein [Lewinellaceae bacterium]